jgi:SulP family sulfate permease
VNIILGQLADLLGSPQKGSPAVVEAFNVITHPADMTLVAAAVGISALLLMVVLSRTRIASVASLVALAVPTLLSLDASGLVRVESSGKIPSGLPTPHIPHLSLLSSLDLIAGAAAVAVIVLVQGTGVAEAAPNTDGSPSDASRDFIAQGIGKVASGFLRGQPVGGSVGQTALNVAAGARTDRHRHPHSAGVAGRVRRDTRRDAALACDGRRRHRRGALAAAPDQSGSNGFDGGPAQARRGWKPPRIPVPSHAWQP